MLPIIFIIPVIQMCILVFAATFEMSNTNIAVVDRDLSTHSRAIISKFQGSPFFTIKDVGFSMDEARDALREDKADVILSFQKGFSKSLNKEGAAQVQILVNAIDASSAGMFNAYVQSVMSDYNKNIILNTKKINSSQIINQVKSSYSFWYNPQLKYTHFMLPGILVLLVTIIGLFLSSMNLVREKEIGTIEQINVTPIRKHQFLIGKLIPFLLIGWFELAIGLAIAVFLFKVPLLGSVGLIFAFASVYLMVILGIGLFISTQTDTQQQAMFIAWFFMVIFILMSGLFTPIESMPRWGQILNWFNPLAHFIKVIRMIMLKGSSFQDVAKYFFILFSYGVVMLALAVNRYRKVV